MGDFMQTLEEVICWSKVKMRFAHNTALFLYCSPHTSIYLFAYFTGYMQYLA